MDGATGNLKLTRRAWAGHAGHSLRQSHHSQAVHDAWRQRGFVSCLRPVARVMARVSPRYFTFRGGRVKGYGHAMEAVGGVHGGEGIGDR